MYPHVDAQKKSHWTGFHKQQNIQGLLFLTLHRFMIIKFCLLQITKGCKSVLCSAHGFRRTLRGALSHYTSKMSDIQCCLNRQQPWLLRVCTAAPYLRKQVEVTFFFYFCYTIKASALFLWNHLSGPFHLQLHFRLLLPFLGFVCLQFKDNHFKARRFLGLDPGSLWSIIFFPQSNLFLGLGLIWDST